MNKITASTLADMLNDGFTGEVMFFGVAFARIPGVEFGFYGEDFYEGKGNFVLSELDNKKGFYLRNGLIGECYNIFKFCLRKGEKASHACPEKYGDIISVPINFALNARLQIKPRDIKY